jgi:hypothetical protein
MVVEVFFAERRAMATSDKERMLDALEASEYSAFPVFDEDGREVRIVNRGAVRRMIEAGHVFDLEHIPLSIVEEVCPIDWSKASCAPMVPPPYEIVKPLDGYKFPKVGRIL